MRRRFFSGLMVLGLCAGTAWAQNNFVYTNNDTIPNTVSAFAVGKGGSLTEVPGSPFRTGGNGAAETDFRFFASKRIVTVGNFLYASNMRSNSVSGFSIDAETGELTPVPGSPFPTGGSPGLGISLAATPDGQFLYAGSDGSRNIRVFRVGSEGELTAIGAPIPAGGDGVDGMIVSPNGKWLAVALFFHSPHGSVAMFRIDAETGELTPVMSSPFPVRDPGGPDGSAAGVDINCASDTLFVGEGTFGTTIVDVLNVDPNTGALTPIQGSPFTPGVGVNSNVPLLSPDDSLLFVSNQGNAPPYEKTVTVFTVVSDGGLTLVPGSPFPFSLGSGFEPGGMATDEAGTFLYVASSPSFVDVFNVEPTGTLTPVPGSPFTTGQPRGLFSLAGFPAKTCRTKRK